MTWALIIILYTIGPADHSVQRREELHLSKMGCEWARIELRIAADAVARAYCVERDPVGTPARHKRWFVHVAGAAL